MAPFGAIQYIHRSFKEIQQELKYNVKEYGREKHRIERDLEGLTESFKESAVSIAEREMLLRKLRTKSEAADFLAQERELAIKMAKSDLAKAQRKEEEN